MKEALAGVRAELVESQAKAKDLGHALDLQAKDVSAAQTEAKSGQEALAELKADMKGERESAQKNLDALKAELDAERKVHAESRAGLAAAKAQAEGLRETSNALREAQQKDRQALEEERKALGKAQVDLATAIAQAQAARDALDRERENKGIAENPKTPGKAPATSSAAKSKPKP